ncbi:MAG: bifunctional DNA-formamidopyrimidine glycosylase/DNA-(apurinic or apyrimidinic site) lyase [Candidatus Nomurabacteria bacterium]|nr:bifunctional DNA-formamidopyrimidine glycosylase/DNA-(apurinic or apyrimidinic site) lyase [Candidatus Nomurabacteria bacterium]
MPELPEVTTTVNGLQRVLPGITITDVWTDLAKENQNYKQFLNTIKDAIFYKKFKKQVIDAKVKKVERMAKNILIHLDNGNTILIHMKMTGHIIYGKYVYDKKLNKWAPDKDERAALHDPYNRFVHVVFELSNGKHFVFCDSRKFGKVTLLATIDINDSIHLAGTGPEPLDKDFSFEKFKDCITKKKNQKIKTILMDPYTIAGIGNIYSDEMLWMSGIHPETNPENIPNKKLKELYDDMQDVLLKGIDFGGDSMSDYRDIDGKKGEFQNHHNVYRRIKQKCGKKKCGGVIIRKSVGARNAHFCESHQILYK